MRRTHLIIAAIAAIILISSTLFFALNYVNPQKQTLAVFCATSLQFPLNKVEADFEKANPNVDVQIQGHGTIQVIRHVTELNYKVDVMLVADYSLIPRMMYPTINPRNKPKLRKLLHTIRHKHACVSLHNNSKYASEVNSNNWYSILSRPGVKLGLANPQLDALGYRALMAVQLSEDYYGEKGLFHNLITANLDPPINSVPDGSNYTITVPDIQQPKGDKLILRASEVDLIALLQTGYLDYCFIYLSNAKQYGLNYVELPSEVNLGSPAYNSNYERIQVVYSHQRFATVTLDRTGEPIYYGLTIPSNAPHPELAQKFIQFLLNGQGKTDFEQDYHPVFSPSYHR